MAQDNPFAPSPCDTPTTLAETLERVAENGYSPIPVRAGQKQPLTRNWQQSCERVALPSTRAQWLKDFSRESLGIALGELIVVDIDHLDPERAEHWTALVEHMLGSTPLLRIGQAPKVQLWYRTDGRLRTQRFKKVELLAGGSFSVAFGNHPETRAPFTWPRLSPLSLPLSEVPLAAPEALNKLRAALRRDVDTDRDSLSVPAREPNSRGLVHDGRDELLYHCVLWAHNRGECNVRKLAELAFQRFSKLADLSRPRSRDDQPWELKHAVEKARSVIRRADARPMPVGEQWPESYKRYFRIAINAECVAGKLPRWAVAVSHAMLAYVASSGGCWASIERLMGDTGQHKRTVQRARELLVKGGYWSKQTDSRNHGRVLYVPNPAVIAR